MKSKFPSKDNSVLFDAARPRRVGYILKRYPRFSETFVVNEILAHEASGLDIDIFALRPTTDTHFQHAIADVRASVINLRYGGIKAETFWKEIEAFFIDHPLKSAVLTETTGYSAVEIYQSLLLARQVEVRDVDHLHAHFGTTAASVARLTSLLTGIPYSFTAHAKDIFHKDVDEAQLGRKIADAAAVITVSDFNVEDLGERFPESQSRIHRIYNGLDLNAYSYSAPEERPCEIVAVGRLVEKKGFSDLIDACALLADSQVDFRCTIIGGGDLKAALQTQIDDLGLQQHIEMTGPRPQKEVHRAIREAAVCVAPCITASNGDRDGLPTILLESMALGTPCLSTYVTGVPEVVWHDKTGLLVPEKKPEQLAQAIQQLFSDADLRVRLAKAARQLIEEEFSIHTNTASLRKVFSECQPKSLRQSLAEVV